MTVQRVTDKASNAPENIERAVQVIGRSRVRRAVFKALHTGRRQAKDIDDIAREIGEGRQQVLDAAAKLANEGIIHVERIGRKNRYRRDPFYQANRDAVLRFVDHPGSIDTVATKRRPRLSTKTLYVPVIRSRISATSLTIDDIQSFSAARTMEPGPTVKLRESQVKAGLLRVIGDRGSFQDWGGEQNDFLTDKLLIRGRRRVAAFALKGPGTTGQLTPKKMGRNGDQIQRLARSPAEVLIVQYHGQVADSVREQLQTFAQLKSVWEDRRIWYCVIDGDDSSRLVQAYPKEFGPPTAAGK